MKTALITGSSGFIGKHLKQALVKNKVRVYQFSSVNGKKLDDPKSFLDLPKVDMVFHLGAVSGYKDSNENPFTAYKVNVAGTVNVLDYCKKVKAKMVFPSTYVYDQPWQKYKKETDKAMPRTHYAYTKYLGEQTCQFYSRVFGVDTLILRTSNVYGPGQRSKYIVPVITSHLLEKKQLTLTKPNIERSYVFIDDVISAYIKLALIKTRPGEIYNVAYPRSTAIKTLVETIEKISGEKTNIIYSGKSFPNDADKNRYDISKIRNKIGWVPEVNLASGLKRYFQSQKKLR